MSLATVSSGWPVWWAMISSIRRLSAIASRAWISMSVAWPFEAAPQLVDQDLGVRERHPFTLGAGGEQQRTQGHCDTDPDCRDLGFDELHRVVDRQAGVDRAARTVDVDRDVLARVVGLEMEQLGHDQVGDLVVDRRAQEDDPLAEQMRVDVGGPLPARVLLDNHRHQRAHRKQRCTSCSMTGNAHPTAACRAGRGSASRSAGRRRCAAPSVDRVLLAKVRCMNRSGWGEGPG